MNQSMRSHCRRQPVAALAALLVLALAARPVQAAGPGLTGYVFALDEKGKITGTVAGAVIEFNGAGAVKATADKNGLYSVDLRGGTYTYKVTAAGFKPEDNKRAITTNGGEGYQVKNFGLSRDKTKATPKPPNTPDIPPEPTPQPPSIPVVSGILQGEVVERKADGSEVPIPGAMVYLRNQQAKSPLGQAMTRMHEDKTKPGQTLGHYELELATGSYNASVVAVGFAPFKQVEPITIVAGQTASQRFVVTRATPPEPKNQGIAGIVKFADRGKAGEALPPATVSIFAVGAPGNPVATFNSGDGDHFQRNLPAGHYRVVAQAKGYRTYPRTIPEVYVLRGSYTKVDVYFVPDLLFGATVYERVGRRTRQLPGASVELVSADEPGSKAEQLTTDKRGYASMPLGKEGNYVAVAKLAGYNDAKGVNVKVSATGANRAIFRLERARPGTARPVPPPSNAFDLTIVAETESKTPLAGAEVTVIRSGDKPGSSAIPPGTTDYSGSFLAKGLSPGSYNVQVSKKGFKPPSPPLAIDLTKNDSREIILSAETPPPPPDAFNLTIVGRSGGEPVSDAVVTVKRAGETVASGKSGPSGSYTAEGLGPGFYVIEVIKDGLAGKRSVTHYRNDRVEIALTASSNPPPNVLPLVSMVTVPNVTGYRESIVRSKLEAVGLKEESTGNPNVGPSRHQNWRAGTQVKPGTVVAVYFPDTPKPTPPPIDRRPYLVTVPRVTGANESVVQSTLAAAELKEELTGNPQLGPVKFQNPYPGARVKPGTVVRVCFPDKPPPAKVPLVTVPNVVGSSESVVKSTLTEASLKYSFVQNHKGMPHGYPIATDDPTGSRNLGPAAFQNYRAGRQVPSGTVVVVCFPDPTKQPVSPPPNEGPSLVTVPNVTGLSYSEVYSTLAAVGLPEEYKGNPNLGPARFQNYHAGAKVRPGTVVVVYYPEAPANPGPGVPDSRVTVPNVTGSTYAVVESTLAAANLREQDTGDPNQGPARSQSIRPGTQVAPGTTIVVYFPEPQRAAPDQPVTPSAPSLVTVPNVTGRNYSEVQELLAAVGLGEQHTGDPNQGPARYQKPGAGTQVRPGTVIYVYYPVRAQAPARPTQEETYVAVPNVTGQGYSEVQNTMAAARLRVQFTGSPNQGAAWYQRPSAGTQVSPGTIVSVYFPEQAPAQQRQRSYAPERPPGADGLSEQQGQGQQSQSPAGGTSVTVPNVTGATSSVVQSTLAEAGLREQYTGNPNRGPARYQRPGAGVRVPRGTVIYVYFP